MFTLEEIAMLRELLNNPGIGYPLDKARHAISADEKLRSMIAEIEAEAKKSVNSTP